MAQQEDTMNRIKNLIKTKISDDGDEEMPDDSDFRKQCKNYLFYVGSLPIQKDKQELLKTRLQNDEYLNKYVENKYASQLEHVHSTSST